MTATTALFRAFALCLGVLAPLGVSGAAAQDYPARPVKWVISFPAGGPNDVVARVIGQSLSERLGQPVIIENKPGAGGSLGMASVLASPPDGYTIAFVAPNYAINATLYAKLPYDFAKDSVPVAGTVGETVPGYETSLWYGIVAPRGTPAEIISKLNAAVTAVLAEPKLVARLADLGGVPMPMTSAELGKLIADDTEKWAKVIKATGVKIVE